MSGRQLTLFLFNILVGAEYCFLSHSALHCLSALRRYSSLSPSLFSRELMREAPKKVAPRLAGLPMKKPLGLQATTGDWIAAASSEWGNTVEVFGAMAVLSLLILLWEP